MIRWMFMCCEMCSFSGAWADHPGLSSSPYVQVFPCRVPWCVAACLCLLQSAGRGDRCSAQVCSESCVEVNDPSANCSVWGETPWAPLPVLLVGMNASPAVPRFSSAQLPFTQWCWSVCREEQGVEVCWNPTGHPLRQPQASPSPR